MSPSSDSLIPLRFLPEARAELEHSSVHPNSVPVEKTAQGGSDLDFLLPALQCSIAIALYCPLVGVPSGHNKETVS